MLLTKEKLQHINTIAHEGKVVVFATDGSGKIHYTIKQDGFEDSYLNTPADQRTGWEDWQELEFPNEATDDQSVIDKETEELTHQDDTSNFILCSRYRTQDQSAVAPVQVVSGVGHIYVFRQSKADATKVSPNTLMVDRFVLDGMTNKLVRKLEVRFKRSRQKYKPIESMKKKANGGGLANIDSLDFRDADNQQFYEPTIELSLINNLHNGWFSVVQVPTSEHDIYRWHIFAYNSVTEKVELTTIRASEEGLFDVQDYTIMEAKPEAKSGLVPRSIPGIIQRSLDLNGVEVGNGFSATKYNIQKEQQTKDGMQLLKDATKVILAIPTTADNVAAISFSVAADGTLSQIDETPDQTDILRSNSRDLLLPLNTLDEIKGIGDSTPPPQGTITGVERGEEDRIEIMSPEAADLTTGDVVKISDTQSYNGHYVATKLDADTFEIDASYVNGDIGSWEVIPPEETGLIFDGAITCFEKVTDNKLKVTAFNHGLESGDEVQIVDTTDYNRTCGIEKIDDSNFAIEGLRWKSGEAVNLKLESRKRRGVMFNGSDEYIDIPKLALTPPSTEFAFGYSLSAWVYVSANGTGEQIIVGEKEHCLQLVVNNNTVSFNVKFANGNQQVTDTEVITPGQWMHYAGVIASDGTSEQTRLTLCKNGQQVGTKDVAELPNTPENWQPEFEIGKSFAGKVADVQIWDKVRTVKDIKDSMYLQLTGREVDLVGYWRLGAITEGKERNVVDFSINGNDGIVHGDAFVSAITLNRTLGDNTTQIVKYSNDDLVAVSARATYIETFEFKTDTNVNPNNVDGHKLFSFSYWGKSSRSSDDVITFDGNDNDFEALGNNWYKATCRFTIPDGVAIMRTFELSDIQGTWSTLEIRKHRVQLISDSITEVKYTDSLSLSTLADQYAALPGQLKTLEQKEQEEASLILRKRHLEDLIGRMQNLTAGKTAAQIEALITQKQGQKTNLENQITTLESQVNQLQSNYNNAVNSVFNYWCEIEFDTSIGNLARYSSGYKYLHVNSDHRLSTWRETPARVKFTQIYGDWYQIEFDTSIGNCRYKYLHVNSSRILSTWRETPAHVKLNKKSTRSNNKIEQAQSNWNTKKDELQLKQSSLLVLIAELEALQSRAELDRKLREVNELLNNVQTALNTANNTVIDTVRSTNAQPQVMPTLYTVSRGSQKGLVAQGALLGFAAPATRITATETCEGNVQLSYFDHQGRMRLTNYDATSDSSNIAFEQWLPDDLPVALNFADSGDKIQLSHPVYLGESWTMETWFSYPLPVAEAIGNLEDTLTALNQNYSSITRRIPNRYDFSDGATGSYIQDGGTDMYDNGNRISTNLGGSIPYSNNTITNSQYLGEKGRYFTRKYPGLFVFIADIEDVSSFEVTGDLGADGAGLVDGVVLSSEVRGVTYSGFVKRVYNAGDSSVNHLVIVESNGSATHYFSTNTNQDQHLISNLSGIKRIYYLLYAATSGSKIDDAQTQIIMDTFLEAITTPGDPNTLICTVDGDGIDVQANSGNETLGVYTQNKFYDSGYDLKRLASGWHHLTAVGKEATIIFYIDGKQIADVKQAVIDAEPDADKKQQLTAKDFSTIGYISTIGNSQTGSQQFGKLSELRLWNLALTAEEIAVNSTTRLSGNEPGLVAYYPLNEATGTEVRDKTGRGNNGTVAGATWWGCNAPIGNVGQKVKEFDGTDDYVEVEDFPYVALGTGHNATIEVWIKTHSTAFIFSKNTDSASANSYEFSLNIESDGRLRLRGGGTSYFDTSVPVNDGVWHHIALVAEGNSGKLYIDGHPQGTSSIASNSEKQISLLIGAKRENTSSTPIGNFFNGQMAEFRIWNKARTVLEIKADMRQRLTGKESGLVGYFPLNTIQPEGDTQKVLDLTGNNHHGTVNGAITKDSNTLPIGGSALVSAEYSTIVIDPVSNKKSAIMRRFFGSPALDGVELLPEKRIEQLELKWIGNAQFAPTLLGYIEGAPPIPTENLTVQEDYNSATYVELNTSEDVEFSWYRSQDVGLGASLDAFLGSAGEVSGGVGIQSQIGEWKAGFKGNLDLSYQWQNESTIASSSSLSMSDRLELRGTQESGVKFSHLGKRFIPKNIGYALVVSSLADVFITRLKRSKKMIGYQVQPVDGVPPDVNTITFLINPAYTMSGSLDGMTGSSATSDRFFRHVPEMRAQYGSLYPASYYRLQEAYDLKQQIEKDDKRRESYFEQFNAGLVDEGSLNREIDSGEAPTEVGVTRETDKPDEELSEEEKQAAQERKQQQIEQEAGAAADKQSKAAKQKQKEIKSKINDQEKRAHATDSFASWQKRMENIQVKSGKRNIVNTYVWDADGGLRTEAQSFANTIEHTVGGSFSLGAGLGFQGDFTAGAAGELTALVTINLTQTMNKTESRSKGLELNVDLSGVESTGITDYNDYPIQPGEKVDRYRFMSFYLEGTTKNFNDFFTYVVDPEWLASNDEEARALRQAKGKANKTWRVLHRVTYVERPALMGFGRDIRQVDDENLATQEILDYFNELDLKNQELKAEIEEIKNSNQELSTKLDQVLNAITAQQTPSSSNDVTG